MMLAARPGLVAIAVLLAFHGSVARFDVPRVVRASPPATPFQHFDTSQCWKYRAALKPAIEKWNASVAEYDDARNQIAKAGLGTDSTRARMAARLRKATARSDSAGSGVRAANQQMLIHACAFPAFSRDTARVRGRT